MSYSVIGKVKPANNKTREAIRKEGGAIVLKHALAMASVAYQVYPVGPPHKDGTPHTRDTFAIMNGSTVIASHGSFSHASEGYEFNPQAGITGRKLSFYAAGASFFLEFGTIFMEAQPILRRLIKQAIADITKDLRAINIRASQL